MALEKRVTDVVPADFELSPVWRYSGSDASGEVLVTPVEAVPVADSAGKVFGTRVTLANGSRMPAVMTNIGERPRLTKHFATLSLFVDERWFHLARYHDVDADARGPDALAAVLKLAVSEVFPIAFDVSGLVSAAPAGSANGHIEANPAERLSASELIRLSVRGPELV